MTQLYRISLVRAAACTSAVLIVGGCAPTTIGTPTPTPTAAVGGSNPLFVESPLPYHAPPFNLIRNEHYQPAVEEGMRQQLAEIDVIARQVEPPTFDNTIVALERSGRLLDRAAKAFYAVVAANTNDTLQKIQEIIDPKLAAHRDAIFLNDQLYQRVKSVYERRQGSSLSPEQRVLLERYNREFVRAGAQLLEADKVRMRAVNQELAKLANDFSNK